MNLLLCPGWLCGCRLKLVIKRPSLHSVPLYVKHTCRLFVEMSFLCCSLATAGFLSAQYPFPRSMYGGTSFQPMHPVVTYGLAGGAPECSGRAGIPHTQKWGMFAEATEMQCFNKQAAGMVAPNPPPHPPHLPVPLFIQSDPVLFNLKCKI